MGKVKSNTLSTIKITQGLKTRVILFSDLSNVEAETKTDVLVQPSCSDSYSNAKKVAEEFKEIADRDADRISKTGDIFDAFDKDVKGRLKGIG